MPRPVRVSLWLLVCGYVLGLALVAVRTPGPGPESRTSGRLSWRWSWAPAAIWLLVFIALRTYQGRNWARWIQLVTQVAAIPSFVRISGCTFGAAPIVSSCYALIFVAEVARGVFAVHPGGKSSGIRGHNQLRKTGGTRPFTALACALQRIWPAASRVSRSSSSTRSRARVSGGVAASLPPTLGPPRMICQYSSKSA